MATAALRKVIAMFDASLDGVCVIDEIAYRDKNVFLVIRLSGLEDRPIDIKCEDIIIAPDGSFAQINSFQANYPFAQNALDKFLRGKKFTIPAKAQKALVLAKKTLGL